MDFLYSSMDLRVTRHVSGGLQILCAVMRGIRNGNLRFEPSVFLEGRCGSKRAQRGGSVAVALVPSHLEKSRLRPLAKGLPSYPPMANPDS
jgi:hypothetical protein